MTAVILNLDAITTLSHEQFWELSLTNRDVQLEQFLQLAPELVTELRSASDSAKDIRNKMKEYRENDVPDSNPPHYSQSLVK